MSNLPWTILAKFGFIAWIVTLFMTGGGKVFAYEFNILGGEFFLTGHFENISSWRTQDHAVLDRSGKPLRDKWELGMCRNILQLELEYTFGERISLFGVYRSNYEASYDIQSVDQRARAADYLDNSLRELYLTLLFDEWTIKIGKQQLVWGETDILRMADVVNPLDLSWHWSLENWEDIRRPLRMIVLTYAPERLISNNVSLEAVFIPEDFKPTYLPHAGSNWQPTLDGWELFRTAFRASGPSKNNDEYGFRIRGVIKGIEISFFDFYGRTDGAVIDGNRFGNFLAGTGSIDFCKYPKFNIAGITANWYEPKVTKTVWRFEGAWFFDEPMNDFFLNVRRKDSINFMLGFDRPTFCRFLNPTRTFGIYFEWFHKTVLDWESELTPPSQSNDCHQNVLITVINTGYHNDVYWPELAFAYDLSGTWFVKPSFKWSPTNNWTFIIGYHFMAAPNKRDSYFGSVRDNDEIFLRIRYGFS